MLKTISFAIMHFGVAFTVAYLLTGDVVVGGAVALVEPAVNTVAYHFHERVWSRFRPGAANRPTEGKRQDAGNGLVMPAMAGIQDIATPPGYRSASLSDRRSARPASPSTVMPSSCALASFEPASLPATM